MINSKLLQTVRGFIADNFLFRAENEALGDDQSLLDSGIVDSTGVLEIIAFLEQTYEISIADSEIVPENLDSVGRIVDYVERKRAA